MIRRSCWWNYLVTVPENCERPPWTMQLNASALRKDPHHDNWLVGANPTLQIVDGRVILTASSPERATRRVAFFDLAPDLVACLRAGDTLQIVRAAYGSVALRVSRRGPRCWRSAPCVDSN